MREIKEEEIRIRRIRKIRKAIKTILKNREKI